MWIAIGLIEERLDASQLDVNSPATGFLRKGLAIMDSGRDKSKIDDIYQSLKPAIDAAFEAFLHLQNVRQQAEVRLSSLTIDEMHVLSYIEIKSQDFLDIASSLVSTAIDQVAAIGRVGWLLPRNFPFEELRTMFSLLETSGPISLGESLAKLYSANDHHRLKTVVERVGQNVFLQEEKTVIEDCLWAYTYGRFGLVIPAVLALIERTVVRGLGQTGNKKAKNAQKTWSVSSLKPTQSLGMISWTAIDTFLGVLWADAPFDQECPPFLNRHWVMHGRWSRPYKQSDALKLLLASVALGDYFDYMMQE